MSRAAGSAFQFGQHVRERNVAGLHQHEEMINNVSEFAGPVSYTHLDVYKRQPQQCVRIVAIFRGDRDAEARAAEEFRGVDEERLLKTFGQPPGDHMRIFLSLIHI